MTDDDDPHGAAQQRPVQRLIEEEVKKPKPPQTAQPTGGAATSALSVDAPPRANQQPIETALQSADTNQATLLTTEQLNQLLRQQREQLRE